MSQTDRQPTSMYRRTLLKGVAGSAAAAAALSSPAAAQTSFGGWLSETSNFDGTVADRTGQDEVTVEVGVEANGGAFGFGPAAVQVDPGTTVVFEWTGQGSVHNVNAVEGASFTSETTDEAGFTFEHAFESEGVVKYQCDPHAALGMKGVVVAGALPEGTPTDGGGGGGQPDWGDWFTADARGGADETYGGETADLRGQDTVTVTVGAEGNGDYFAYDPSAIWIDPGTTVEFEWTGRGGGHNVVAEDGPADLDSGDPVSQEGVNYTYTFEETGITTYYCTPHLALGMKGGVAVGDDVPKAQAGGDMGGGGGSAGGGGEGGGRPLPGGDIGAAFLATLFGAAGLAVGAVFAGELYNWYTSKEATRPATEASEAEGPWTGVVREIGHEEFDPFGTAWLVALYFVILLVLWVFMYFVEFLGNGPTVVG